MSGRGMVTTTVLSVSTFRDMFIVVAPASSDTGPTGRPDGATLASKVVARPVPEVYNPMCSPAAPLRNERRVMRRVLMMFLLGLPLAGGAVDGGADALIGATAAHQVGHHGVDVGVGRRGLVGQQRCGGHHLAGLAVAALRDVLGQPGALDRVAPRLGPPPGG